MEASPTLRLLSVSEAANRLRISKNATYELIRTGKLKSVRPFGRTVRVVESDLIEYLEGLRDGKA